MGDAGPMVGQRPAGSQSYLANMPESWAGKTFTRREVAEAPTPVWVLGAWGVKGDTEGTY